MKLLKDPRDDIAFHVLECLHLFLSLRLKEMHNKAMTLIRKEGKELFKRIHEILDNVHLQLCNQKYVTDVYILHH